MQLPWCHHECWVISDLKNTWPTLIALGKEIDDHECRIFFPYTEVQKMKLCWEMFEYEVHVEISYSQEHHYTCAADE